MILIFFRSVSRKINDFRLEDFIDPDVQIDEVNGNYGLSAMLTDSLGDKLHLKLQNQLIRILPKHWKDQIVKVLTFQAGKYKGSDISKMCRLNGKKFQSLLEMTLFVCNQRLEDVPLVNNSVDKTFIAFVQGM